MDNTSKSYLFLRLVFLLSVMVLSSSVALGLSNPSLNKSVSQAQSVNITVDGPQGENVELRLLPPKSPIETFEMNGSNGTYWKRIDGSHFQRKGRYGYRFIASGGKYPENSSFGLTVSSLNQTLRNRTLNTSYTEHYNDGGGVICPYKSQGDFSCEYENFQAFMILSSAIQFNLNKSNYTREKFHNFTFGDYETTSYGQCSQEKQEFNCGNSDIGPLPNVTSGIRQGTLIYSLWNSYDLVDNSSVKNLAQNYTRGSAQNCDVWGDEWNKSYSCGNARGQGSMALGYWAAYEQTGNETYRDFASKLTSTNYSNPRIISAYLEGYSLTSNNTYLAEAENRTKQWLDQCPNCSAQEFMALKNALWRGYRVTGEFGYYRNAVNLTAYNSSDFCSWNSSSCSYPNIQGMSTLSYWRAYNAQQDVGKKLFDPQIGLETVVGENLTINIRKRGKISRPDLLYREKSSNGSWSTCEMTFFEGCKISGENLSKQTPYSFKFSLDNKSVFPKNGSFTFATSLRKDVFADEAAYFSEEDPSQYCQPGTGDFTCEGEVKQSAMISGFSSHLSFNQSENSLSILRNLIEPPYVVQAGIASSCDVESGYLSCKSKEYGLTDYGSRRQGELMESIYSAYRATGNNSHYQRALNYTLGVAEDCDVWGRSGSRSFECGSSRGQASMIEGYLEAYRVTGNSTFRGIAMNLTEESGNMSYSPDIGGALWKSASYFNESRFNYSVTALAENVTEEYVGFCNSNCSSHQYLDNADLFQSSYLYSGGNYSTEYRNSVLNTTESGSCGPFKLDRTCDSPADQGDMIDLFWEAAYTMPVELKVEDSFNLSDSAVTVGEDFTATCSVENKLEETNITGLEFDISTSSGISIGSNNSSYSAGKLQFNETESYSWNLSSESPGVRNVSCALSSDTAYRNTLLSEIEVQEKETRNRDEDEGSDSSGGGGSGGSVSSGGLGDLLDQGPENKSYRYNNSSSEIEWNRSMLEELGINTTFRDFTYRKSCFNVSRSLYQNTSEVLVNYSCQSDGLTILDKIPENFSVENAEKISGYALKSFENVSGIQVALKYDMRGKQSFFGAPLVLSSDYEVPPVKVNTSWAQNLTRENETIKVAAELSRPVNCTVKRNGTIIYSERAESVNETFRIFEGNNTVEITCGKAFSESRVVQVEKPEENIQIPITYLLVFLGLSIVASSVYYRSEIYSTSEQLIFDHYMDKFEAAMENGDQAEAIQIYSKVSGMRDEQIGKIILESDLELMRGLRIYLILDLLEDDEVANSSIPIGGDIESLVERFLEDTEDEKLERMIEEKLAEVSELNNRK